MKLTVDLLGTLFVLFTCFVAYGALDGTDMELNPIALNIVYGFLAIVTLWSIWK